jgi:uncharacterized FlaG/YvyC family protein
MPNEISIQRTPTDMTTAIALHNRVRRAIPQKSQTPEAEGVASGNERETPTVQQGARDDKANPKIDPDKLNAALTQLNANISLINERYSFQVDQNTEQLFVQVKNREGEVIRQAPPEAILEIAADISRMIGVFLDKLA